MEKRKVRAYADGHEMAIYLHKEPYNEYGYYLTMEQIARIKESYNFEFYFDKDDLKEINCRWIDVFRYGDYSHLWDEDSDIYYLYLY